jgi:carbamoylphosphate synthase large subunit
MGKYSKMEHTVLVGDKPPWQLFLTNTKYQLDKFKDINDLLNKHDIRYLLPVSLGQQAFIHDNSSILKKHGYKYLIPSKEIIKTLNNKSKFNDFMIKNNLDLYIPKKYKKITYPCILKKKESICGKEGYVINSKADIPRHIKLDDYLIQEPILGNCEHSTDILAKNGEIILISPNKYCYDTDLYIMGYKLMSPAIKDEITKPVYDAFAEIIKVLNYNGFCNIDYKILDTGYPKIFEINPRCGGSLRDIPIDDFNDIILKYIDICN